MNIDKYNPGSGRVMREDDSIINTANYLSPKPIGHEVVVMSAVASSLHPPEGAIKAYIQIQGPGIICWFDGTDPNEAMSGFYLETGDIYELESPEEIAGFRAIRTGNSDFDLAVAYGG